MPVEVFFSYAHEDEELRDEIEKALALLRRRGLISGWHDRQIRAGSHWADEIDSHARSAQVILLLISADFLASDYCWGVEMKLAMDRQHRHEAVVIPIVLRPVDWSHAPFAILQALPRNAKPITTWANRDEAFADVARGIREVVEHFQPNATVPFAGDSLFFEELLPQPRVLDAAIPSHIVKDRATELLVLVRLPDSPGLTGVLLSDEETEARPEDVRSKPFGITFPRGPDGRWKPHKLTIQLTSPEFTPPAQAKNLFVPPDADSDVCPFMLTPIRTGPLKVLIEVQWEDALRGARRLVTECVSEASGAAAESRMNVLRMPVAVAAEGLVTAFSMQMPTPSEVDEGASPPPQPDSYRHAAPPDRPSPSRSRSPMIAVASVVVIVGFISAALSIQGIRKGSADLPSITPRVNIERTVTSGLLNFGCGQTLTVETPAVVFGTNPKDIRAQPAWVNTSNSNAHTQKTVDVPASRESPRTGIKAVGTITGLACPGGGGRGELTLSVTWTEEP